MALFEKTAPKDIKNSILSQKRLFFIFLRSLSTYRLNIIVSITVFLGKMNRELLLFLTFSYTRNANQRHFIIY